MDYFLRRMDYFPKRLIFLRIKIIGLFVIGWGNYVSS
jgi:hypothetical protein